jgi:hypothetical protein
MERLGVGLGDHVSFVVEGDRVEVVAVEWKLQR